MEDSSAELLQNPVKYLLVGQKVAFQILLCDAFLTVYQVRNSLEVRSAMCVLFPAKGMLIENCFDR
jgi:hypothetical protein